MIRHVCLFTDSLVPSGVGQHMLTLAAELREHYRVSVVCPPSAGGLALLERAAAMGLDTRALTVRGKRRGQEALGRWLRARQVDLFHAHAGIGWEGHAGISAARLAGVPVVVRTEHLPALIGIRRQHLKYRRLIPAVDRFICVSDEARASFACVGVPEQKLRTVRNGISRRPAPADREGVRARLGLPSEARIVLTVGRMTEQKGYDDLLAAIPDVLARQSAAHFVWVGEGPRERRLRPLVRARGLDAHVHLVGSRPDVPELMAAADLFVLPSLLEGLLLVVLEAMAAGLPVIGTQVCGTAEAVRDGVTGRLVPVQDPEALTAALLEVLECPTLAAQWGAAGRRRVEREFSAARMARETATIYDELLAHVPLAPTGSTSMRPA